VIFFNGLATVPFLQSFQDLNLAALKRGTTVPSSTPMPPTKKPPEGGRFDFDATGVV
jgi:hypothetical protein